MTNTANTANTSITAATTRTRSPFGAVRTVTVAAVVVAALGLSACGAVAEKATEQGVEQLIESSVDDQLGDFDIDLSDGNFSIDTGDGSFSFGEDGSMVFDTDEGTFVGQVDEHGIELSGDDGSFVDIDLDETGDAASISVETDDGTFEASTELATLDDWPADIPRPTIEHDEWVAGSVTGDQLWLTTGGSISAEPRDAVLAYASMFDGAEVVAETWGESEVVTITTDDWSINVLADVNTLRGGSSVSYTIASR